MNEHFKNMTKDDWRFWHKFMGFSLLIVVIVTLISLVKL